MMNDERQFNSSFIIHHSSLIFIATATARLKGIPMKRHGFSLVELIVVLVIGTILLGLVLPAVKSAQVAGVKKETINNLKQLGLACHNCNDTYKRMPPAFDKF